MNYELKKYKMYAWIGIILMGIGSYASCLATQNLLKNGGTFVLIIGLILSIIGFYRWRP